jgi:Caspase domain
MFRLKKETFVRVLTIAAFLLAAAISLGFGRYATLHRAKTGVKLPVTAHEIDRTNGKVARIALLIGNGHYPDAETPLTQPINDARALNPVLRNAGFYVIALEDANKVELNAAVERLKSKMEHNATVVLFYGGYGIQIGRENFMIPVDAKIWSESDVERDGVGIEPLLSQLNQAGGGAEIVVIDASRRNPFERRFREYSHGLAPIDAPDNALVVTSELPDQIAYDSSDWNSVLVSELLKKLSAPGGGADAIFNDVLLDVARKSHGEGADGVIVPGR